jgi:flagellar motor switch protein FliN/FliY
MSEDNLTLDEFGGRCWPPKCRSRCSGQDRLRPGAGVRRSGQHLGRAGPRPHVGGPAAAAVGQAAILELDRKVGEAIDIYVNNRLVARGEVVVVDERLGVTMTEIIKDGDAAG